LVISEIRSKQQGFWGGASDFAPDLIAATKPGYYLRSFWHAEHTGVKEIGWHANHVWNDAIVYAPFPLVAGYQPMLWDVLPTVLTTMGVDLPSGLDGRSLKQPIAIEPL
jgi:hypothetical protein